jgi:hypothetical protein
MKLAIGRQQIETSTAFGLVNILYWTSHSGSECNNTRLIPLQDLIPKPSQDSHQLDRALDHRELPKWDWHRSTELAPAGLKTAPRQGRRPDQRDYINRNEYQSTGLQWQD